MTLKFKENYTFMHNLHAKIFNNFKDQRSKNLNSSIILYDSRILCSWFIYVLHMRTICGYHIHECFENSRSSSYWLKHLKITWFYESQETQGQYVLRAGTLECLKYCFHWYLCGRNIYFNVNINCIDAFNILFKQLWS